MSYSCLPNMGNIIKNKNNNLLKEGQEVPPSCNCTPGNCPVDGKCSLKGVIYQATLKTQDNETHKYVGLTDNPFIQRFQKHLSSFRVHDPRNSTSLSKLVLELQRKHTLFDISWKILQTARSYRAGSPHCRLCNTEIYFILFHSADATLNSRQELTNKCRHQNKFKLNNFKT